jgi:hypothetical protein
MARKVAKPEGKSSNMHSLIDYIGYAYWTRNPSINTLSKFVMRGFKNVVKTWGSACLIIFSELDGMNIIGIGCNVFALPQFSMLKSTVQQFFKLVFAEEIHPNETSTQNFADRPTNAHKVY